MSALPLLPCRYAAQERETVEIDLGSAGIAWEREGSTFLTAESSERIPIEFILTGNVWEDKALFPFLQIFLTFSDNEVSIRPLYQLTERGNDRQSLSDPSANAYMQICVFEACLSTGSHMLFTRFLAEWLSTGLRPLSYAQFAQCFLPYEDNLKGIIEKYTSAYPAPGLLVDNHYLSSSQRTDQLLSLLSANYSSTPIHRTLNENCNPGCTPSLLSSSQCVSPCNVSACEYQNWACTCIPGCTPDLLMNTDCDSICSFPECYYDNGFCPSTQIPSNYTPYEDPSLRSSTEPEWAKWVIVALSLVILA
jgi:hypothetical protein